MPVSLQLADLAPRAWRSSNIATASALFTGASERESNRSKRMIQSSFTDAFLASHNISSSTNGLVYTLYSAWSGHHHLTLRPEDIWFGILSQLNFYINAHAEELRSFFVAHQGQKELKVSAPGTDFGALAISMTGEIEKNVLDPDLRSWIMPEFSTTTTTDRVVASILMMGAMQSYFSYTMRITCGIPTVTLLGERADWAALAAKVGKIPTFGKEPAQFAALLKPVLDRFVETFDSPNDTATVDFWNRIVHESGDSGPHYLSGWAAAFCFWDEDGQPLWSEQQTVRPPMAAVTALEWPDQGLALDGVVYHYVDMDKIPAGYASVPVKVDDNGIIYDTKMLAGSAGIEGSSSGRMLDLGDSRKLDRDRKESRDPGLDTIQPLSGWFMYEVESAEDRQAREKELADKKAELERLHSFGDAGQLKFGSASWERMLGLNVDIDRLMAF